MEKQNLAGHLPLSERAGFLSDNCDKIEQMSYLKKFTEEEILEMKDRVSVVSIEINDTEAEKKLAVAEFLGKLKPLVEERNIIVSNIKSKAVLVDEECYKFIDHEEGRVRFYNKIGDLVEDRMILASERQKTMFSLKNGTND